MKRFQPPAIINMPEDPEGAFCLFSDALQVVQSAVKFAMKHADDIENDINDFGDLKPILAMIPKSVIQGSEVEH